ARSRLPGDLFDAVLAYKIKDTRRRSVQLLIEVAGSLHRPALVVIEDHERLQAALQIDISRWDDVGWVLSSRDFANVPVGHFDLPLVAGANSHHLIDDERSRATHKRKNGGQNQRVGDQWAPEKLLADHVKALEDGRSDKVSVRVQPKTPDADFAFAVCILQSP